MFRAGRMMRSCVVVDKGAPRIGVCLSLTEGCTDQGRQMLADDALFTDNGFIVEPVLGALKPRDIREDGGGDLLGGPVAVPHSRLARRSSPYISPFSFSASRIPSETKTIASPGCVATLNSS